MGTDGEQHGSTSELLELRIHGVLNTPSYEMLETTPQRVETIRGDQLAGFSTYRQPAPDNAPTDRRVEAYAWGRLSRFTGIPSLGRIGDALVKLLWFALAPYGLANTAYWSRSRIGTGEAPEKKDSTDEEHRWIARTISTGLGAGTMRLYGLLLSLLFVTTAATVALDMIGRQCFATATTAIGAGVELSCPGARIVLAPLGELGPGTRDALLLGLPLLALAAVVVLPMLGRTRYLTGPSRPGRVPPRSASALRPDAPLLAQRDLWLVGSGMERLRRLHTGAALAWLAAILAFDHADGWQRGSGAAAWAGTVWPVATGLAVLLTLGGCAWIVKPQAQIAGDVPRRHAAYLVLCMSLLAAVLAAGIADPGAGRGTRAGASAAMVVVLALAVTLVALLVGAEWAARTGKVDGSGSDPGEGRKYLGWKGRGPFILGSLAAGFALLLSFAVVLGAGWVLRGPKPPLVYVLQGAGFLLFLLAALSWLALRQAAIHRRGRKLRADEIAAIREHLVRQAGNWTTSPMITHSAEEVHHARRQAALLRRMEVFIGWIGWAVFIGICVGLLALIPSWGPDRTTTGGLWPLLRGLGDAGLWAGMIAVAALYLLSRRSDSRPLGLLWDLMCFLPTQAHPFGPSCYAERVVPELADRIVDWFAEERQVTTGEHPQEEARGAMPGAAVPEERGLVVSAHSMGIVLAVCALFQLPARGLAEEDQDRIGMLSYGCQLRRYFARFFPGVCGPGELSLVPAGPPSPTAHNPWPPTLAGEIAEETDPGPAVMLQGSLGTLLGERWLNLYRPTDPLGFPARYLGGGGREDIEAASYQEQAYQFLPATHGDYLESTAYVRGFSEVRRRLR
ncbi:hypothetical protein ACTXOR_14950 [Arthrobacter rhombi]|uniref:hypothetical protein n=1 Tax=Arthrobacter rhombi TaxID=71253 RepID=UPI003FD257B2